MNIISDLELRVKKEVQRDVVAGIKKSLLLKEPVIR